MTKHYCHAQGCFTEIHPKLLMCQQHWRQVPGDIKRLVLTHYRSGQEIDKSPSAEYLAASKLAIKSIEADTSN